MFDRMPRTEPLDVALEITPPRSPRPEVLLRRARALGELPRCVNVIHRTDRWSSLDASIVLRASGFDPVWHLANRGRRVPELEREIERAAMGGVRRVLCIRGEYKADDSLETPKIRETVGMIRRALPRSHISVTLNHHQRSGRAVANLLAKLEAGANAVQTQLTLDLETLRPMAEALKARWPQVAITPMLIPVLSLSSALALSRRLSIPVPPLLSRTLASDGAAAGWQYFSRLVGSVRDDALFDGVALMTPMDIDDEFATRVIGAIAPRGEQSP